MKYFTLSINQQNIATLIFDTPKSKANTFSILALNELETLLIELKNKKNIKGLFIESAKKDIFIAGADIKEIQNTQNKVDILHFVQKGQEVFNLLDTLIFPSIAIIDGACLGGGLELALSCTYRIATEHEHTRLGLPEVNLGIIPGFGGTQRLYPLVGYAKAMELMVAGKQLKANKALKIGLIDVSVPKGYLKFKKEEFTQALLNGSLEQKILKRRKSIHWYEKLSLARAVIAKLTEYTVLKKTKGNYPAPIKLIEVMQESYGKSLNKGLEIERHAILELLQNDVSKNLIELFLVSETLKHESFVHDRTELKAIQQSAIVGTGTMGSGIAWTLNNLDIDVRLKVRSSNSAINTIKKIRTIYENIKRRGRLTEREVRLKMDKITFDREIRGFHNCDLLIEAVNEDQTLKQAIYQEFETKLSSKAIIATNTSSLSISSLAENMTHPERLVGMHFFNPVNRMPLVEIIAGEKTNNETITTVVELSKKMGKIPIRVKESSGFLVNRILLPYLGEATLLFEQGANMQDIDGNLLEFGMPMGPLALIDEVGVDIGEKVSNILHEAYGNRIPSSPLLSEMIRHGWLGKKTDLGFYNYQGKIVVSNSKLLELQKSDSDKVFTSEDILERCIFIMINEASRCLEEEVVTNARYLDMAMVMGTGFPAFRGGLLRYADSIGLNTVVKKLQTLEELYGERFTPSALLLTLAQEKKFFYN